MLGNGDGKDVNNVVENDARFIYILTLCVCRFTNMVVAAAASRERTNFWEISGLISAYTYTRTVGWPVIKVCDHVYGVGSVWATGFVKEL